MAEVPQTLTPSQEMPADTVRTGSRGRACTEASVRAGGRAAGACARAKIHARVVPGQRPQAPPSPGTIPDNYLFSWRMYS